MRVGKASSAVVGVAVLGLAAASPAPAQTDGPPLGLTAGPVLAGSTVVWAENQRGGVFRLRAHAPGALTSTLYRSPPPARTGAFQTVDAVAASPTRLAFRRATARPTGRGRFEIVTELLTGSLGGPFEPLTELPSPPPPRRCRGEIFAGEFGVTGDVVAFVEASRACDPPHVSPRMVRRDFAAGGSPGYVAFGTSAREAPHLEVAGRFAAWTLGPPAGPRGSTLHTGVAVYDLLTRRQVYGVASPGPRSRSIYTFDLQADGKLAVVYNSARRGRAVPRIAWFARARPRPHRLPFRLAEVGVRMAGDRIAFVRARGARGAELAASDLAGSTRRIARLGRAPLAAFPGFDFDGTRTTWATRERTRVGGPGGRRRFRERTTIYLSTFRGPGGAARAVR